MNSFFREFQQRKVYRVALGYTSSLLRPDPIGDRLRADPAFQKLCDKKQP